MNRENEKNETLISELSERLFNGVVKENPTFVLLLGMCPTLAVTTSAINGLGMGVTTLVVLALSNLFISLLRKIIPDKIRIPAFIVIIASFVTIVELLLEAYIPSLYSALGLYIPLIVVNCIILGRAEAYAYSHKPLHSLFDGLGMGMGFTFALTIIGALRELIGAGTLFSQQVMPKSYIPASIFIMAPGAFFVLAILTAIQNKVKEIGQAKGKDMSKIQSGCGGNCLECNSECDKKVSADSMADTSVKDIAVSDKPKADETIEVKKEAVTTAKETKKDKAKEKEEVKEDSKILDSKLTNILEDFETIDLDTAKKVMGQSAKRKPKHNKAALEKAALMLSKAEEAMKEEKDD